MFASARQTIQGRVRELQQVPEGRARPAPWNLQRTRPRSVGLPSFPRIREGKGRWNKRTRIQKRSLLQDSWATETVCIIPSESEEHSHRQARGFDACQIALENQASNGRQERQESKRIQTKRISAKRGVIRSNGGTRSVP